MVTLEQLKIIEAKDKYMLVIAGAGSGKTFTIIERVKHLITKGYLEKDILVISFSRATVKDLKERLPNGIEVRTFHSLALKILRNDVKKIINDYDINYMINEYFSYIISKKNKKRLALYLDNKGISFSSFKEEIKCFLNIYKANDGNFLKISKIYLSSLFNIDDTIFITLFMNFYYFYQNELESMGAYDYNDLIDKASKSKNTLKYQYIIVDEFQDTSLIRLKLLNKVVKDNDASLLCVGDDYQSIYQFSGSNIKIFTDFKRIYPKVKTYKLTKTFRNSKELITVAGSFIMKNDLQIKKSLDSGKLLSKPIVIVYYENIQKSVNKLIKMINTDYMILGRNNRDNLSYDNFYTIHKSKGLESDNVIIVNNLNEYLGFPSLIKTERLIKKLINIKEIPLAEERRLFYVALTRTKNKVYLMVDKKKKSLFVKEIEKDYNRYIDYIDLR